MEIAAVICVRNEQFYIGNCLDYLVENGIGFAVVDNQSCDETINIVRNKKYRDHLLHFSILPYAGAFELQAQLECKQRVIEQLSAEWIIHLDADEIIHSYRDGETLGNAIRRIGRDGSNVINLDEFVFLPVNSEYRSNSRYQTIRTYYFFEPQPHRLMRIWRRSALLTNVKSGGHVLDGNVVLSNESLALRHYIFRNQSHAFSKYTRRRFSDSEVIRGWHQNRIEKRSSHFAFPPLSELHILDDPQSRALSCQDAKKSHYWEWIK